MTHREKLLALLEEFGVSPTEGYDGGGGTDVTLVAKQGNVEGYSRFICSFDFAPDGKFRDVGIWE